MKIFISWSGPKSKEMSIILRKWLPLMFPNLDFFISDEIEKGANFLEVILKQLQEAQLGLFLLTKGNTKSQWLQFEAGAFASKGLTSKIFPMWLDDNLEIDETGPLRFYQGSRINETDLFRLLESINRSLDKPFDGNLLLRLFDAHKKEFFYNWSLISNLQTTGNEGSETNKELLRSILNIVSDSRSKTEDSLSQLKLIIGAMETQYNATIFDLGGKGTPKAVRLNWKECTFSDDVEKKAGMAKYSSKVKGGGHFTSNLAWEIATGEVAFSYQTLPE